jgi:hypothetical protein
MELDKFLGTIQIKWKLIKDKQNLCRMVGLPGSVKPEWRQVEYVPRLDIVEKSKQSAPKGNVVYIGGEGWACWANMDKHEKASLV